MLDVEWSSRAKRGLKKVPADIHDLIVAAVNRFAETGEGDVAFLHSGKTGERRLRVRDWRVVFRIDGGTMEIRRVSNRRDAYSKKSGIRHGTEAEEGALLEGSVEG